MSNSIICVADDVGVRVWLERVLESEWNLEMVSSSDLSRVSRLVQATGAAVVVVAVDEHDSNRALKVFSAIQKACPEVHLIGVSQRVSQDLLLSIMRAGARDCLITGIDSDSARERVRKIADAATPVHAGGHRASKGNITLLMSASPIVDSRFFAQNFVCEMSGSDTEKSILALDTNSETNKTFYYDNLNRLTLNDLVSRGDSVDRSFIETALEEFSPGLRLLSGQISPESLEGDLGADIYITMSQLAGLFDHLVIRVEPASVEGWLRAMGSDISNVILLTHPAVDQVQASDAMLKLSKEWVGETCRFFVVVDGFEKKSNLSLADIEKTLGLTCQLTLPLEWRCRLDAINAGIPMSLVPAKNRYERKLRNFVKDDFLAKRKGSARFLFKRAGS